MVEKLSEKPCASGLRQRSFPSFETYMDKFKKACQTKQATGEGATEEDRQRGIHSMEGKLESICPFFSRMEHLFSHRDNINPAATRQLGTTFGMLSTSRSDKHERDDSEGVLTDEDDTSLTRPEATKYASGAARTSLISLP